MAKRRKLETPSAEDLNRIEAELDRGAAARPGRAAPIAQVAAESAGAFDPRSLELRTVDAKDKADAERLRAAEAQGLVMLEVPLDDVQADALVRDRVVLDAADMEELKASIARGGLRLPIEIFPLGPGGTHKYGLLSGYRRLMAFQQLRDLTRHENYNKIKAVVRNPEAMGGTFAAMIEENEIRASLSHYERGRIAVIAAGQGAFVNVEEAVNALFPVASKAKRSKIRSFALVHEELGDMLRFPDLIKERLGLRLAAALRDGAEHRLRGLLAEGDPETPEQEAVLVEAALNAVDRPAADPARGGRPKARREGKRVALNSGITLASEHDGKSWLIRVQGKQVDSEMVHAALLELERLLKQA